MKIVNLKREVNLRDDYSISTLISITLCVLFVYLQVTTAKSDLFIGHLLWFLWFVSVALFNNRSFVNAIKKRSYSYFYIFSLFYFLTSSIAVGFSIAFNRLIELFEIASPVLMFDIYKNVSKKIQFMLLLAFTIIILFSTINLLSVINQYGLGLRLANQDDIYINNAFNWTYSWVIIVTISGAFLYNKKISPIDNRIISFVFLVLFFVGVLLVVSSLFMTAILSMILGIIVSFFYGRKRWIIKTIISAFVGGVLFMYSYQSILGQVGWIHDTKGTLSERVEDIYNTLSGNLSNTYDLNTRNDLYSVSLTTFSENPIIGINHTIKNVESVKYVKIGNHSEWFDNLALYGAFSLFLFLFLFKSSNNGLPGMPVVFIVYMFIGFVNPLWYFLQNFVTFFFVPLLINGIITCRRLNNLK